MSFVKINKSTSIPILQYNNNILHDITVQIVKKQEFECYTTSKYKIFMQTKTYNLPEQILYDCFNIQKLPTQSNSIRVIQITSM